MANKLPQQAPRIVVDVIEDSPNLRVFHFTTFMSNRKHVKFYMPLTGADDSRLESVGINGSALISDLNGILGIDTVFLETYRMGVFIGQAFDWTGIEEAVIEAIRYRFSPNRRDHQAITVFRRTMVVEKDNDEDPPANDSAIPAVP